MGLVVENHYSDLTANVKTCNDIISDRRFKNINYLNRKPSKFYQAHFAFYNPIQHGSLNLVRVLYHLSPGA